MLKFTVLTNTVPPFRSIGYTFLRIAKRLLNRKPLNNLFPKYGGHPAVTRSLIEGLTKIGADFNYNPKRLSDMAETVVVLGYVPALKQAISLKRQGRIKKLIAGPSLLIMPDQYKGIIASPEVDICLVPSNFVIDIYERISPTLKGRTLSWPSGVDTQYWRPVGEKNKKKILFYFKRPPTQLFDQCINYCKQLGLEADILYYGKYTINEYKDLLNTYAYLVHFVDQESQGISLLEAWSMDVPTLVWNPEYFTYQDRFVYPSSSSPYLTPNTGRFFRNIDEFKRLFVNGYPFLPEANPRQWVVNNMSDEVSAALLLEICNNEKH